MAPQPHGGPRPTPRKSARALNPGDPRILSSTKRRAAPRSESSAIVKRQPFAHDNGRTLVIIFSTAWGAGYHQPADMVLLCLGARGRFTRPDGTTQKLLDAADSYSGLWYQQHQLSTKADPWLVPLRAARRRNNLADSHPDLSVMRREVREDCEPAHLRLTLAFVRGVASLPLLFAVNHFACRKQGV